MLNETGGNTMLRFAAVAVAAFVGMAAVSAQERKPDKVIEVAVKDGSLSFTEQGQAKSTAVTVVVGQMVRWVNRDAVPHRITSSALVDGKPILEVGAIKPGEHFDFQVTNNLYRLAGGKPAGSVTIIYHSRVAPKRPAELVLLSAAKR
jgi:plastocyanin